MSRLKELREGKQKKQEELAEYLGISPASYSKKESGQIRISLIEAKKLSIYFGEPIDEIFFSQDTMNEINSWMSTIDEVVEKRNKEQEEKE